MNVQEILQTIKIETIQIVKIETTRIIDHKTTPTIVRIMIIVILDP